MADYTLSARIVGDSSSLNKSINKANSALSDFKKETSDTTKKASSSFSEISKSGEKAASSVKKTWSELSKETGKSVQELKKQADDLARKYQSQGVNLPLSYKKAYADLGVDIKRSKNELQEFEKTGSKATQKLGTDFSSLKNKIAGLVAGLGLTKLAVQGISYNANIEQLQTSFEVMTGSADKARDVIDKLKKIGASTPYEIVGLAETVKGLMQYGAGADEAIELTQMLGDAAQGDSQKLSQIALAYGQMRSTGTATWEDLKQMIEAGFNPLNDYAESVGMTTQEIMELAKNGELSFAQITEAIKVSTSEGGTYYNSSKKQAETLNGKWSTLKDTFNEFLGNALKPVTNFMRDTLLPTAIDVLSNFEKYKPILQPIAAVLGILAIAFVAYNLQAGIATGITTALAGAVAFLTSPITLIIAGIALLVAGIMYLWKTNETFRNIVMQAWLSIQYTLSNIWNNILKPIFLEIAKIAMDIYNNGIKPLWEKIQEFVVFFIGALAQMWNKIAPFVNMFIDKFGGVIVQVISSVARGFGNAIKNIMSLLGAWLDNIKQVINGVKQIFNGIIDFVTGVFTGNWEKAWDGVKQIFGGIFESLGGLIKMPLNAVVGVVNDMISRVNGISIDIPDWVPGVGGKHFGVDIPTIPYLKRGTDDFAGGFARINEAGRGELVNLPNGTQVIPHDISIKYAKESARINSNSTTDIDYSKIGEYVVNASSVYAKKIADGVEKGIAKIKVISNNRETARFLVDLGFVKG